jgi:hypothetical protein
VIVMYDYLRLCVSHRGACMSHYSNDFNIHITITGHESTQPVCGMHLSCPFRRKGWRVCVTTGLAQTFGLAAIVEMLTV